MRDALHAEIVTASSLPAESVVWDRQKLGTRPLPAIELRLEGPATVGAYVGEPLEEHDEEANEIVRAVAFDEEYVLRVQARHATHAGASALASSARRRMLLESVGERLEPAGVVVLEATPVLDVGELVETDWQGRSAFTIRLRVGSVEVDPTRIPVIESAPVSGSAN